MFNQEKSIFCVAKGPDGPRAVKAAQAAEPSNEKCERCWLNSDEAFAMGADTAAPFTLQIFASQTWPPVVAEHVATIAEFFQDAKSAGIDIELCLVHL